MRKLQTFIAATALVAVMGFAGTANAQNLLPFDNSDLVAYYSFDASNGSLDATDDSSNSNDGTVTNATADCGDTPATFGNSCSAVFDGSDDSVEVATPIFADDTLGTLTAWFKMGDPSIDAPLVIASTSVGGGFDDEFLLQWQGNEAGNPIRVALIQNGVVTLRLDGDTGISDTDWHHAAATSDGSTIKLYVDGVLQTLTETTGSNTGQWFDDATDTDTFSIGGVKRAALEGDFDGNIDEVRVYDRVLTADEIDALAGAGAIVVNDDDADGSAPCATPDEDTVQEGIDAAAAQAELKTVLVCPGTYAEDLTITGNNIQLVGDVMATSIIQGVGFNEDPSLGTEDGGAGGFPFAVPNIDLKADGVRITNLTIKSPELTDTTVTTTGEYSSGIVLSGEDIRIDHNYFEVSSGLPGSVAIQTWDQGNVPAGNSIDGLTIDNNTFMDLGAGFVGFGYEGIFINTQDAVIYADVNITDNTFGGNMYRGVGVVRDKTNVSGNTMCTNLSGPQATVDFGSSVPWGVRVFVADDVLVDDNTMGKSCPGNFGTGIDFSFAVSGSAATGNTVDHAYFGIHLDDTSGSNTVDDNGIGHSLEDGIWIESDYNSVNDNTTHHSGDDGVEVNGDYNTFEDNNSHHNTDAAYLDDGNDNCFDDAGADRNKAKFNGDNTIPSGAESC